jgi:hypothetical protein
MIIIIIIIIIISTVYTTAILTLSIFRQRAAMGGHCYVAGHCVE